MEQGFLGVLKQKKIVSNQKLLLDTYRKRNF